MSDNLKILCITPVYWPAFQYGGPIFSVHNLNRELVKLGVEVIVFTTNSFLEREYPFPVKRKIHGVEVHYFPLTKNPFLKNWRFSFPLYREIMRVIREFHLVYLPSTWDFTTFAGAYLSRRFRVPYVISPKGMLYPETFRKKFLKKWLYYKLITEKDLQMARAIIYTTEDEKEKTEEFLSPKSRGVVIPNGIVPRDFTNLPDKESLKMKYPHLKGKRVVLFLGRLVWTKGLDILLEAFSQLKKEFSDIHLLICGKDEKGYGKKIEKWIEEYKLNGYVTITGHLNHEEKKTVLAGSEIFVLPSYSENFGMAVVEAMVSGLPVIISDRVGIHREVESANAGLVVPPEASSLFDAMKFLLIHDSIRKEIAENGKKMAEEFYDIRKVAEKTKELFLRIVSNPCDRDGGEL